MGQGIEEGELRRLVDRLYTLLRTCSYSGYHIRFLGRECAGQAHQIAYIHSGGKLLWWRWWKDAAGPVDPDFGIVLFT